MRKILLTAVLSLAGITTAGFLAGSASAITLSDQSGIRAAAEGTSLKQDVRWVCRYGYYGGRRCFWVPYRAYGAYGYYPSYRRYYYRPYYRYY
jgi:hypothetical protein